jgi:hypothetical protein
VGSKSSGREVISMPVLNPEAAGAEPMECDSEFFLKIDETKCKHYVEWSIWSDVRDRDPYISGTLKWDGCMQTRGVHLCESRDIERLSKLLLEVREHGSMMPNWDG